MVNCPIRRTGRGAPTAAHDPATREDTPANAGNNGTRTITDMQNIENHRMLAPSALLAAFLLVTSPWTGQANAAATPIEQTIAANTPGGEPVENDQGTPTNTPGTDTPELSEPSEPSEPTPVPSAPRAWRKVVVDLSEQDLTIYDQHGEIIHIWGISSGAPKTPTSTGRYHVTSKSRRTFAVANPDVTMQHMVRFDGGIGFHSIPRLRGNPLWTPLGERGVSHGCIRMADANARTLYRNLPIGATVIVQP